MIASRLTGFVLTALLGAAFLWGAVWWLSLGAVGAGVDPAQMRENEQRTYEHLGAIIKAQERYRQRDWDGDGSKTYASFYIHLWRSVDLAGNPVPVNLISREQGFAMARLSALDGYRYKDIHEGVPIGRLRRKAAGPASLDPAKEWAVAAMPLAEQVTGMMPFVAESSGSIWTYDYPGSRKQGGGAQGPVAGRAWIRVRDLAHLREIQAAVSYPSAAAP